MCAAVEEPRQVYRGILYITQRTKASRPHNRSGLQKSRQIPQTHNYVFEPTRNYLLYDHPANSRINAATANAAHSGRFQSQTRRPLKETNGKKGTSTSSTVSDRPAT